MSSCRPWSWEPILSTTCWLAFPSPASQRPLARLCHGSPPGSTHTLFCFLPFESSADPVLLKLPCCWSVWPHIELMLFCITCWVELDLYFGCVVNTVDFKSNLDFQVLTVAVMWVVTRGLSLPSCLWINLHLYYSSIVDPVSFKCVSNPVLQIHDLETSQLSVYHFYSRQSATDLNYIIGMNALTIECSKIAARCQKLTWHVLSS